MNSPLFSIDDDVRVEKLVQQVNAQIETHLGESLDKFFS